MTIRGPRSQNVRDRLRRRLHPRYLRWLARQPVASGCLSKGWRGFRRSCRRSINAFVRSRLVRIPVFCVAVCAGLFILGAAVALVAAVLYLLPAMLFAPPEHHRFASLAERDAVALTRLTVLQSAILPLLFLWAAHCFCNSLGLETRAFYEKNRLSRLVGYRLGFLCFLAYSAAVTLGATAGHDAPGYGVMATLTVTGCLGWLAWAAAKRLMAVGRPRWLSSPGALAATLLILLLPTPYIIAFSYRSGSAVLAISRHLTWLGPLGWVNDLLLGLSLGHVQNALPLAIGCVVALSLGYQLNRPTSSWAFRRRLLSNYRTRRVSQQRATTSRTNEQHVARDLRQALSENVWKPAVYPRWMKGHVASLLALYGMAFLMQLLLACLVLFLGAVERKVGSGFALNEKRMLGIQV